MRNGKALLLISANIWAISAGAAHASDGNAPEAPQISQPDATASTQEIVVTARRREEVLRNVPQAITAFSQRALVEAQIQNPYDLAKAVPGLNVEAGNGNSSTAFYSIRGRGFNFGAASGSVETYFADVPLSSPFQQPQLPLEMFDIQSLQVLKGPQGTLFGRNSTGGAVVVVPQAPTDRLEGYLRLQGGNYGDFQAEGAINVPLGEKAALRISGLDWQRRGYMTNTYSGPDPFHAGQTITPYRYENQDTQQVRASLRVNLSDALQNTLIATYTRDAAITGSSAGLNLIGVGTPNGKGAFESPGYGSYDHPIAQDYRGRHPTEVFGFINTTTFRLSNSLKLKNIASFIKGKGDGDSPTSVFAFPGVNFGLLPLPRSQKNRQFTDEFQIQGTALDDKLEFTTGALYDQTREPKNIHDMNFTSFPYQVDHQESLFTSTNIDSFSIYASATYKFTPNLELTEGVRHTWDKVESIVGEENSTPGLVNNCPDYLVSASTAGCILSLPRTDVHQHFQGNAVNATLSYKPNLSTLVYAGYRLGYKRGGVNSIAPENGSLQFGAETINEFMAGVKAHGRIGGMTAHLDLEGFYDLYNNQQVSYYTFVPAINGITTVTINAPKTTYRGFDVDAAIDLTNWLSVSANYTFVDAYYTNFPDPTATQGTTPLNLAINPVAYTSRNKVSIASRVHYDLGNPGEFVFIPRLTYQSKEYSSATSVLAPAAAFGVNGTANVGGSYTPGYTLLDFRFEWNRVLGSRVNAAVNVTNVTNRLYFLGESATLPFRFSSYGYAPPRMFNVEVSTKF